MATFSRSALLLICVLQSSLCSATAFTPGGEPDAEGKCDHLNIKFIEPDDEFDDSGGQIYEQHCDKVEDRCECKRPDPARFENAECPELSTVGADAESNYENCTPRRVGFGDTKYYQCECSSKNGRATVSIKSKKPIWSLADTTPEEPSPAKRSSSLAHTAEKCDSSMPGMQKAMIAEDAFDESAQESVESADKWEDSAEKPDEDDQDGELKIAVKTAAEKQSGEHAAVIGA